MSKIKLPKLSKVQTTKIIVFSILIIWTICTFGILAALIFKASLIESHIVNIMEIYGHVTLAMNAGVIGYMAKSTYENQNKYGKTPYGKTTDENAET